MNIRKKILQTAGAGALLAVSAGVAQANLLTNGGFESPEATGGDEYCSTGWNCFNQAYTIATDGPGFGPVSHDAGGTQSLKEFGFDGGALQSVAVVAGTTYEASVWAMNWDGLPGDPFGEFAFFELHSI